MLRSVFNLKERKRRSREAKLKVLQKTKLEWTCPDCGYTNHHFRIYFPKNERIKCSGCGDTFRYSLFFSKTELMNFDEIYVDLSFKDRLLNILEKRWLSHADASMCRRLESLIEKELNKLLHIKSILEKARLKEIAFGEKKKDELSHIWERKLRSMSV